MTEEENEAINNLIKLVELRKSKAGKIKYDTCICSTRELETILNLIQKQQAEIEKLNYIKKNFDYVVQKETEKKDKIIDKMAETMSRAGVGRRAFACDFGKECNENGCRVCIKQYFEKKVESKFK